MVSERKKKYVDFNVLQAVTFAILFIMIIAGVIIIRNINAEYKTRKIAGEMQRYKYAVLSFNNVYNGLPGDLDRATFYWKDKAQDGDGDRVIGSIEKEKINAWQHLQLSGQLEFESNMVAKWYDEGVQKTDNLAGEGKTEKSQEKHFYKIGFNIPKSQNSETESAYILGYDKDVSRNYLQISDILEGLPVPS